jgi:hypothetical protein
MRTTPFALLVFSVPLWAATPASPASYEIAAPDLAFVNLSADLGVLYEETFTHHLSVPGVEVMTAKKIAALVSKERARQLLGCSDTNCLIELGNALGADAILTGSLGRVGDVFQANLSVISSRDGTTLSARSAHAESQSDFLQLLAGLGDEMGREIDRRIHPVVSVGGAGRRWSWIPAGAGVVAAGVGTGFLLAAQGSSNQLVAAQMHTGPSLSLAQASSVSQQGQTQQTVGLIGLSVGVAAVVAGAAMFALGGAYEVRATASLSPAGGGAAISGVFP